MCVIIPCSAIYFVYISCPSNIIQHIHPRQQMPPTTHLRHPQLIQHLPLHRFHLVLRHIQQRTNIVHKREFGGSGGCSVGVVGLVCGAWWGVVWRWWGGGVGRLGQLCVVFDQCVVGEFFVGEHIATGETANGDNHLGEEWVEWVEWMQREKKGKQWNGRTKRKNG